MSSKGWYALERGWMNSGVFKNEKFTEREAWVFLIEHAAWKATKI